MPADLLHRAAWRSIAAGPWLRRCERLCLIAGAAMIVWWAVLLADAHFAQQSARRSLELASQAAPRAAGRQHGQTGSVVAPPHAPRQGDVIGLLSVPRIDLSAVVLHGSDPWTLRRGPGHVEHTALPGEPGNVVIAGHRDSFFRPLRHIRVGDDVFVSTADERIHYRVQSLDVVQPHDLSVLEQTDEPTLTLITCFPFWVLGDAPNRFVVRAARAPVRAAEHSAAEAVSVRAQSARPSSAAETASSRPTGGTAAATDDATLVRQVIERFRQSYNGRLMHEHAFRRADLLTFEGCHVIIAGDRASADCESSSAPPDGAPTLRTFALERGADGWTIGLLTIEETPLRLERSVR